jgi:hypothetical protein
VLESLSSGQHVPDHVPQHAVRKAAERNELSAAGVAKVSPFFASRRIRVFIYLRGVRCAVLKIESNQVPAGDVRSIRHLFQKGDLSTLPKSDQLITMGRVDAGEDLFGGDFPLG